MIGIIPTDLVTNSVLSFSFLSYKLKTRIKFSASWYSGKEKYFCFLFIVNHALLQSHFCSYYSSMLLTNKPNECCKVKHSIKNTPFTLHHIHQDRDVLRTPTNSFNL